MSTTVPTTGGAAAGGTASSGGVSAGTGGGTTSGTPSTWLGGVVPCATGRDQTELVGVGLGVKKEDRENIKTSDRKTYYKIRDTAIEGMENKFTQR